MTVANMRGDVDRLWVVVAGGDHIAADRPDGRMTNAMMN
jgi:hypothetical protein